MHIIYYVNSVCCTQCNFFIKYESLSKVIDYRKTCYLEKIVRRNVPRTRLKDIKSNWARSLPAIIEGRESGNTTGREDGASKTSVFNKTKSKNSSSGDTSQTSKTFNSLTTQVKHPLSKKASTDGIEKTGTASQSRRDSFNSGVLNLETLVQSASDESTRNSFVNLSAVVSPGI